MSRRPARIDPATGLATNPFLVCQRCGKQTVCKAYRHGSYFRLCLGCDPVEPQLPAVIARPVVVVEEPREAQEFVLTPVVLERVTERVVERVTERTTERVIMQGHPNSRRRLKVAE